MKALRYPSTYIYAPYASAAGMLLNKNRKFTAVNRNSPLSEKGSTLITRQVPLVEQELLTLLEHLNSLPFCGVCDSQFSV
jgi:hypothetical protein